MARIGYARVSTTDQNLESQIDALTTSGCEKVFAEKASGKLTKRPELDNALGYLRAGDVLVITRLSRLARSLRHLLDIADELRDRGIDLVVIHQNLDTTTPGGRLLFHLMAAFDEFTRELIVEGTHEGLAAARARGRKGGRKTVMNPQKAAAARQMYDSREHTVASIAKALSVSPSTIRRHLAPDKTAGVPA